MNEFPDIHSAISRPDLFAAFRQQLQKDLELCGLENEFAADLPPDYPVLLAKLRVYIERLVERQPQSLYTLLYRIDITERQIKAYSQEQPEAALPEIAAELIIKRELQKVVLKQYFK